MARWAAVLSVKFDGQAVATTDDPSLLYTGVNDLEVRWGRDNLWSHQDDAQATVTLYDRANVYGGGPLLPTGKTLELWFTPIRLTAAGVSDGTVYPPRRFFYGRVTEAEMTARTPDPVTGDTRGPLLRLTAVSRLAELGTVKATRSYPWENLGVRWNRLRDLVLANTDLTDVPFWPAPAFPVEPQSGRFALLPGLREMADNWPLFVCYDPHAHALRLATRYHYPRLSGGRAAMVPAPGGETGALAALEAQWTQAVERDGAIGPAVTPLPMQEFTGRPSAGTALERTLTGVDLTYPGGSGYAAIYDPYWTTATENAGTGQRRLTLSVNATQEVDARAIRDRWLSLFNAEGDNMVPADITHATREMGDTFPSWDGMHYLIGGREWEAPVFLHGHALTAVGYPPYVAVIGGTIRYADGHWSPTIRLGPLSWTGGSVPIPSPVTWATCVPGGTTVAIKDLDPMVTIADCVHWTAPYGTRPAPAAS